MSAKKIYRIELYTQTDGKDRWRRRDGMCGTPFTVEAECPREITVDFKPAADGAAPDILMIVREQRPPPDLYPLGGQLNLGLEPML